MPYEIYATREDPTWSSFVVKPFTGTIGAFIEGLDISKPLDDKTVKELNQAWVHYQVLFFRDQDITPEQHVAFATNFGEVQMGGSIPRLEEQPEIKKQEYTLESQRSGDVTMHADDTFVEIPSKGSFLYGVKMPATGGDTIWINCEAAYAALSDPWKKMLDGLTATHDLSANFGFSMPGVDDLDMKKRIRDHYPAVSHPVIRTHPESGRKCLFVNEMVTTKINEMEPEESQLILHYLFNHLKKPLFQCRLHWTDGTMVMWDNRSVQHVVVADFQPCYRLNHRIAIQDTERPV